jgi:H+/Cl- antiporter ClcA
LGIKSWSRTIPQITGPMVPAGVLATMPDALKKVWLDTPIWKVLAVLVLIILSALLVLSWLSGRGHKLMTLTQSFRELIKLMDCLIRVIVVLIHQ